MSHIILSSLWSLLIIVAAYKYRRMYPWHLISKTPKIYYILLISLKARANMVLFFLIFFLFLSLPNSSLSSFSFNSSMPLCHSHQSFALLHFRNSFSVGHSRYECYYYSYPMKKSWKMGTYCCGWDGVTCDTMTGHVIGLDLSCSGKSPTTISKGNFQSHLESLSHWRGLIFHTIILWLGLSCVIKWKTEMAC